MAKLFGILLIVLGVWIGLEIFTQGTDSAFGGLFATSDQSATGDQSAPREAAESPAQRIRARVQRDISAGAARSTAGIAFESPDEAPSDEDGASDEFGSEE
jgi:hypothetical protein